MMRSLLFAVVLLFTATASAQNPVLAELFRNVNCANCRPEDDNYEQFLDGKDNVIVIYYHNQLTLQADPFYQASKGDVDKRSNQFYQIFADPQAFINGDDASTKANTWKTKTTQAAAQTFPVTIAVTSVKKSDTQYDITLNLTGSTGTSVQAYAALVEDNLSYANTYAYGPVPDNLWHHVFRKMLPTPSGSPVFTLSGSKDLTFTADLSGKDWKPENMKIVAFVQDADPQSDNKSYLVRGVVEAPLLAESNVVKPELVADFALAASSPNPFSHFSNLSFMLKESSKVTATVTDALGRTVATIAERTFPQGKSSVRFDPQELPAGIYAVQFYVNGEYKTTSKVIYQP